MFIILIFHIKLYTLFKLKSIFQFEKSITKNERIRWDPLVELWTISNYLRAANRALFFFSTSIWDSRMVIRTQRIMGTHRYMKFSMFRAEAD